MLEVGEHMKRKQQVMVGLVALLCVGGIAASVYGWKAAHPPRPLAKRVSPDIPKQIQKQIAVGADKPMTSYDWTLTPAGDQKTLGDFPIGAAMSPDHRYMVVTNDGFGMQSIQVVDLAKEQVLQTISYRPPEALYLGVAFSPDGKHVYASAGGNNKIRAYDFANGKLTERAAISYYAQRRQNFFPGGLTVSRDGKFLFVANNEGNSVSKVDIARKQIVATTAVGHKPYTVLLSHDGTRLYASNWGENTVSLLDPTTMQPLQKITVGLHPNALAENPKSGTVYVADSDSDEISAIDPQTQRVVKTYSLLPEVSKLTGSQPNALSCSPDGKTLYVANAGNNDVAVIDLDAHNVAGLIPTAWYPTGVYVRPEANQLLVLNGKGMGSGPNSVPNNNPRYVGNMMRGTLSFIPLPDAGQLQTYTETVRQNNYPDSARTATIPRFDTTKTPIKHVIYVIRENRTYDQIFGDIARGNGDPSLVMFGRQITPNAHKLASQFVLLDNFYADAEVSAQGHNWAVGAKANDYVEKNWPANYSGRNREFDFEGNDPATYPKAGFLWDEAARSNVTFRDYGEFYRFDSTIPNDPTIGKRYDPNFWGWDLKISDVDRFREWSREFEQFEAHDNLPQLEIVRLPNDHTAGTRPGFWTPQSMVAQNDYALGLLVQTVSESKYWKDTAIFITEDDAQAGVDHVDSHRTVSLVVSPYTQTHKVDSTVYDTTSMLHTMELILGMKPLTQYDAAATPMLGAFTDKPNFDPFVAIKPSVAMDRLNTKKTIAARASELLDFSSEDKADENSLNHILWQATHGNEPYPNVGNPYVEEDDDDK